MNHAQPIFGFLLFVFFTSREILWLRPWTGNAAFNTVLAALGAGFYISLFMRLPSSSPNGQRRFIEIRNWDQNRKVLWLGIFMIFYLLIHEAMVGDGWLGVKYAFYTLTLLCFLTRNVRPQSVAKVFVALCMVTSIAMTVQALLIIFLYGGDLSWLPVMPDGFVEGRDIREIFVNPFGLGLVSLDGPAHYGDWVLYRALALTSEPKYSGPVLLVGLVCLLGMAPPKKKISRMPGFYILLSGIFFCHAYSSFAVLVIALLVRVVGKRKSPLLGACLVLVIVLQGIGWMGALESGIEGFARHRLHSFLTTTFLDLDTLQAGSYTLFGQGKTKELAETLYIPNLVRYTLQYGLIGLVCIAALFGLFFLKCLRALYFCKNPNQKLALALAPTIWLVYLGFFTPELLTLLYCFLFGFTNEIADGVLAPLKQKNAVPVLTPVQLVPA